MINKERIFLGYPQEFRKKFLVYPPLVKDVVGNKDFAQHLQMLTISKEELEDELLKEESSEEITVPTPLEFILANSYHDEEFERIAKEAFQFFIHQDVTFIYEQKKILIGDLEEEITRTKSLDSLVFLEEDEFFDFQNMIREVSGGDAISPPDPDEHPKIRRMKALARYRDKVKAKSGKGLNLETILSSICCMGLGITPLNIGEISYVSANTILRRYQEKEKYETDVKSLLAGADSKKIKPKYWIRNLD